MGKKKFPAFPLSLAWIGLCVFFVAVKNVFALHGLAYIGAVGLSTFAGLFTIKKLSSAVNNPKKYLAGDEAGTAALIACKKDIENYLRDTKSTLFFREKLQAVSKRIDAVSSRSVNMKNVITSCFGTAGLSYGKFFAPVLALQEYLVGLINSLVLRMKGFNEEEYRKKINDLAIAHQQGEAEKYREIEQEHKEYAEKTILALDDAILKLDKLALEISKLGETDVEKAMDIMHDLDTAIEDTRYYK